MLWSLIAVLSLSASLAATDRLVFRCAPAGGLMGCTQQTCQPPAATSAPRRRITSFSPLLRDTAALRRNGEDIFSVCTSDFAPPDHQAGGGAG